MLEADPTTVDQELPNESCHLRMCRAHVRLSPCRIQVAIRFILPETVDLSDITVVCNLFILNSVRIPLGWLVGLNRQSSADGSNGRASGWRECLVAAFESKIDILTHAC